MLVVHLIRHAASANESSDFVQGRSPEALLTPEGEQNALLLGHILKARKLQFVRVWCSTAVRAVATARIALNPMGIGADQIRFVRELEDKSEGEWEGKQKKDVWTAEIRQKRKDDRDGTFKAPQGESLADVQKRMLKFFEDKVIPAYENQPKQTVNGVEVEETVSMAVFGHGFPFKALLSGLMGIAPQFARKFVLNHTSITTLTYSPKRGWNLIEYNDTSHLRGDEFAQLPKAVAEGRQLRLEIEQTAKVNPKLDNSDDSDEDDAGRTASFSRDDSSLPLASGAPLVPFHTRQMIAVDHVMMPPTVPESRPTSPELGAMAPLALRPRHDSLTSTGSDPSVNSSVSADASFVDDGKGEEVPKQASARRAKKPAAPAVEFLQRMAVKQMSIEDNKVPLHEFVARTLSVERIDAVPPIDLQKESGPRELRKFVEDAMQVRETIMFKAIVQQGGAKGNTGDAVSLVFGAESGKLLAVVKVFNKVVTFESELAALARLHNYLEASHVVDIPDVLGAHFTLLGNNSMGGVIVMEAAQGAPLDDIMAHIGSLPFKSDERNELFVTLCEAVVGTAKAFAALHNAAPNSSNSVPIKYMSRFISQVDDIILTVADPKYRSILESKNIDIHLVREKALPIVAAVLRNPGRTHMVHGDAHVGNVFWDKANKGCWLIDVSSLNASIGPDGFPIGMAARDVCNFIHKLAQFGIGFRMKWREVARVQKLFLNAYHAAGGQVTEEALAFFHLRCALGEVMRCLKTGWMRPGVAKWLNIVCGVSPPVVPLPFPEALKPRVDALLAEVTQADVVRPTVTRAAGASELNEGGALDVETDFNEFATMFQMPRAPPAPSPLLDPPAASKLDLEGSDDDDLLRSERAQNAAKLLYAHAPTASSGSYKSKAKGPATNRRNTKRLRDRETPTAGQSTSNATSTKSSPASSPASSTSSGEHSPTHEHTKRQPHKVLSSRPRSSSADHFPTVVPTSPANPPVGTYAKAPRAGGASRANASASGAPVPAPGAPEKPISLAVAVRTAALMGPNTPTGADAEALADVISNVSPPPPARPVTDDGSSDEASPTQHSGRAAPSASSSAAPAQFDKGMERTHSLTLVGSHDGTRQPLPTKQQSSTAIVSRAASTGPPTPPAPLVVPDQGMLLAPEHKHESTPGSASDFDDTQTSNWPLVFAMENVLEDSSGLSRPGGPANVPSAFASATSLNSTYPMSQPSPSQTRLTFGLPPRDGPPAASGGGSEGSTNAPSAERSPRSPPRATRAEQPPGVPVESEPSTPRPTPVRPAADSFQHTPPMDHHVPTVPPVFVLGAHFDEGSPGSATPSPTYSPVPHRSPSFARSERSAFPPRRSSAEYAHPRATSHDPDGFISDLPPPTASRGLGAQTGMQPRALFVSTVTVPTPTQGLDDAGFPAMHEPLSGQTGVSAPARGGSPSSLSVQQHTPPIDPLPEQLPLQQHTPPIDLPEQQPSSGARLSAAPVSSNFAPAAAILDHLQPVRAQSPHGVLVLSRSPSADMSLPTAPPPPQPQPQMASPDLRANSPIDYAAPAAVTVPDASVAVGADPPPTRSIRHAVSNPSDPPPSWHGAVASGGNEKNSGLDKNDGVPPGSSDEGSTSGELAALPPDSLRPVLCPHGPSASRDTSPNGPSARCSCGMPVAEVAVQ